MFIEENNQIEVYGSYDVAVCGGGFGGISAALAAARMGKRVLLMEKEYILGGLGTAGIVTIYLPLCDGMGRQVSFGIAEELLRLSILHGAEARYPANWLDGVGSRTEKDPRFEVQYNPQVFAVLAEKLLQEAGVEILYGTYVTAVKAEKDKLTHLIAENKSGRQAYRVGSVVDATGDCDIANFAKAPTETFKQGNVLAAWYYSIGKQGYRLNMLGYSDTPEEEKKEKGEPKRLLDRRFSGLDGKELSEQVCLSHQSTYNDFLKKESRTPNCGP